MSRKQQHQTYWQFARSLGFEPWQLTGKVYSQCHHNYQRFAEQFRSAMSIHYWLKKAAPNRLYGVHINKAGEAV